MRRRSPLAVTFGLLVALVARPSLAQHNATRIVAPASGLPFDSGPARPYPSTINLGPGPAVFSVSVILHGLTHPCPQDLDILLAGPDGTAMVLMSDVGGCPGVAATRTLTFSDGAWPVPSDSLVDGAVYGPTDGGAWPDYYPPPAPTGKMVSSLAAFRGKSSGGSWRLFVVDGNGNLHQGEILAWTLVLRYYQDFGIGYTQIGVPAGTTGETMGPAYPYPIPLTVSGVNGRVDRVVTTVQLRHQDPDDLDLLLAGPGGEHTLLMSDAGGYTDIPFPGVDLTFDDTALATIGDSGPVVTGTCKPVNYGTGDVFPAPAPAGPYPASLSVFRGVSANGTWHLFAVDDAQQGTGIISGWSLRLITTSSAATPMLSIEKPATFQTASPFVYITADVDDATDALVIWRNAANGATGVAMRTSTSIFGADVPVVSGSNTITFTLTNAAGEQASKSVVAQAGQFSYHFPEGATGPFFDLDLSVFNPNTVSAPFAVSFLTETGKTSPKPFVLQPRSRIRIPVESLAGEFPGVASGAVSSVITSTGGQPLVAERTMFWDASRYGGHAGSAVAEPATLWLFAEGSQGFFDTFLLLANAGANDATATVTFLRENGPPVVRSYPVKAGERVTVWTATIPELQDSSFGIRIISTQPIAAERAMYFSGGSGRLFEGGHESSGVTRGAREWFFAEGATGPFFDTYLLVSNPNYSSVPVTLTYRTDKGQVVEKTLVAAPNSRLTVNVETQDAALADTAVSTTVSAPLPIVAERAMYWPGGPGTWREAHNSFGLTETGERWAVADCREGGPEQFETYVLLVNPEPVAAHVLLTFARTGLASPVQKSIVVPANSRATVTIGSHAPEIIDPSGTTEFSVIARTTNLTRIAVERATYWDSGGQNWAGGSNVTATRLR